jgi:hypothetical protein
LRGHGANEMSGLDRVLFENPLFRVSKANPRRALVRHFYERAEYRERATGDIAATWHLEAFQRRRVFRVKRAEVAYLVDGLNLVRDRHGAHAGFWVVREDEEQAAAGRRVIRRVAVPLRPIGASTGTNSGGPASTKLLAG